MDLSHTQLSVSMKHYNYYNLIMSNTYLKGDGSCIDLIRSEHHHLIYSMLKTTFEKKESKKVTYCSYNQFQWENFEKDLTSSLRNCKGQYESYE